MKKTRSSFKPGCGTCNLLCEENNLLWPEVDSPIYVVRRKSWSPAVKCGGFSDTAHVGAAMMVWAGLR
jgi:hypothetical protein